MPYKIRTKPFNTAYGNGYDKIDFSGTPLKPELYRIRKRGVFGKGTGIYLSCEGMEADANPYREKKIISLGPDPRTKEQKQGLVEKESSVKNVEGKTT